MPAFSRHFAADMEITKKDDDHKLHALSSAPHWPGRSSLAPGSRRRIIYTLCFLLFLYLITQNLPAGLRSSSQPLDRFAADGEEPIPQAPPNPKRKQPPRGQYLSDAELHYHDGPIKFYELARSLHAAAKLGGQKELNRNVVFAAASLKSVSELLPLACQMAKEGRNDVHMAVMGREDSPIPEIEKLNGITELDCDIRWHDARPDFGFYSSEYRMEASVAAAVEHIYSFIHPQVFIIDDASREETFLIESFRSKTAELFKPLIELSPDAVENMMWMTKLDSVSLGAWPNIYVDIVIQAPSGSSGSFIRLLKSLQKANYFGARYPHLTIELPSDIDPSTWAYLQGFVWPPHDFTGTPQASQVTLRHRIARKTTSEMEASARLLESFYPKRTMSSHVLLLSPQVEVSPLFYHYLFYALLEYKHSAFALSRSGDTILGLGLHTPKAYLNDSTAFEAPLVQLPNAAPEKPAFLWQSPNSDAMLVFSDKWMEFHSFLRHRVQKAPSASPKKVSEKYPAWLEHLVEFMSARAYAVIYPPALASGSSLVTVHDDLYQVPEEYADKHPKIGMRSGLDSSGSSSVLGGDESWRARKEQVDLLETSSLSSNLGEDERLKDLTTMIRLSPVGEDLTFDLAIKQAEAYAQTFRETVGECPPKSKTPTQEANSAADLFCEGSQMYDHFATTRDAGPRNQNSKGQEKPKKFNDEPVKAAEPVAGNNERSGADSLASDASKPKVKEAGDTAKSKEPEPMSSPEKEPASALGKDPVPEAPKASTSDDAKVEPSASPEKDDKSPGW